MTTIVVISFTMEYNKWQGKLSIVFDNFPCHYKCYAIFDDISKSRFSCLQICIPAYSDYSTISYFSTSTHAFPSHENSIPSAVIGVYMAVLIVIRPSFTNSSIEFLSSMNLSFICSPHLPPDPTVSVDNFVRQQGFISARLIHTTSRSNPAKVLSSTIIPWLLS